MYDVAYIALFWKGTLLCKTLGTLIMTGALASKALTLLITVERFIRIVLKPFQTYGFTILQCISCGSVVLIFLVLPPLLASGLSYRDIENSMCIIVGNSVSMPFSIYYIICCIVTVLIISILTVVTIRKVRASSAIRKTHATSVIVAIRLMAYTVANTTPLVMIALFSTAALLPYSIPPSVEASTMFILFPLNSCLNPIINTFTTGEFLKKAPSLNKVWRVWKVCVIKVFRRIISLFYTF